MWSFWHVECDRFCLQEPSFAWPVRWPLETLYGFRVPVMTEAEAKSWLRAALWSPAVWGTLNPCCFACLVEAWLIGWSWFELAWSSLFLIRWRLIDLETSLDHRSWDLSWCSNLSCSEKTNWREEEDRKNRRRYEVTQEGVWKVWVARLYSVWIT